MLTAAPSVRSAPSATPQPFTVLFGVFINIRNKQANYSSRLNRMLFLKSTASNEASLNHLVGEAARQESIEAIIAYFFLWFGQPSPAPLDQRSLEAQAAAFLTEVSAEKTKVKALRIQYLVHEGVEKLRQLGMVSIVGYTPEGVPLLRARPIAEALERVHSWKTAQKVVSRTQAMLEKSVSFHSQL